MDLERVREEVMKEVSRFYNFTRGNRLEDYAMTTFAARLDEVFRNLKIEMDKSSEEDNG